MHSVLLLLIPHLLQEDARARAIIDAMVLGPASAFRLPITRTGKVDKTATKHTLAGSRGPCCFFGVPRYLLPSFFYLPKERYVRTAYKVSSSSLFAEKAFFLVPCLSTPLTSLQTLTAQVLSNVVVVAVVVVVVVGGTPCFFAMKD
jgi:hypothetical protein